MGIFNRKKKVESGELAKTLLQDYILDTSHDTNPNLNMNEEQASSYLAKMQLYRLALVLMVLMSEEKKSARFTKVRETLDLRVCRHWPP